MRKKNPNGNCTAQAARDRAELILRKIMRWNLKFDFCLAMLDAGDFEYPGTGLQLAPVLGSSAVQLLLLQRPSLFPNLCSTAISGYDVRLLQDPWDGLSPWQRFPFIVKSPKAV